MSLTYSQKQYVQKHFPEKTVDEIAKELDISSHKIQKHIDKHHHIFENKVQRETETQLRPGSTKEWLKISWINLVVLAGLVIIVYINAFTADFVSDDIQGYVELEKMIKSPSYIFHNPTFVLRSLEIFVAYKLGGMTPIFFRIYNFIAHIGVVFMVYRLVPFFSKKKYLPFIVAAFTAVHPMMIESVTWISGGIYVQSALFALISFYFYIRNNENKKTHYFIMSLFFFMLTMSVSEKNVVFPAILLLYEFCFNNLRKNWMRVLPFFVLAVAWLLLLIPKIGSRLDYLQTTNGTGEKVNIYNPLTQVPIAIGTYIKLFFWPRHLTLYHSDFYRNVYELLAIFLFFISYTGALIYTFFTNKKIFFWFAFFITSLLVTLNPFGLSWVVAERYIYLGSIAVYFLAGYALHKLLDSEKYKTLGSVLIVLLLVGYSIRTLVRNHDWRNVDNLWIATGKASPSDPKTHNNLGDMYARHGNMEMAIKEFTRATELNPGYSAAYYNIGNTYKHMRNEEKAYEYFMKALEINPTIWQAYMNIAIYHFEKGNIDEAEKYVSQGLKHDPKNPGLHANLGVIYYTKGNKNLARQYLQSALQFDPENQFALGWMQKINQEQ